jgi:uncharacterized metal-binding protein
MSSNEILSTMNVFTVSPYHPKLSFVSKISPSPDWFTGILLRLCFIIYLVKLFFFLNSLINKFLSIGINAVDLCLSNCTWIEQYSEDLYPLDAGIDSGTTYTVTKINSMMKSICLF